MSGGMSGGISGPIRRSASVRRLVAIGVTLITLLSPFLWLLQMSFKSNDLILQFPPPLPSNGSSAEWAAVASSTLSV